MTTLGFGVGLFPTEPLSTTVGLARLAEDLGFGHVWVGDSQLIWREAYVNLTAATLATTRIVLGTGVTNLVTRDLSVAASAFATLQEAFPRRLVLGVGLGDSAVETLGRKPARLATFELGVQRIRELLAGRDVALESGTIRLKHATGDGVPIYVAASGPKMLELAGRVADGVIVLVGVELDRVRRALDVIRVGARGAGRDPDRLDLVLWVPCAVADDGAREAVKAHVARALNRPLPFALDAEEREVAREIRRTYDYYAHMDRGASQARVVPDWLVDRFAIAGTPAECRAAVKRLDGSGIHQLAIVPYGVGGGDRATTLRRFAAAIMAGGRA